MVGRRQQPSQEIVNRRRIVSEEGPDPIDQHVGARIRQQRVFIGLSQTNLGKAIGLTFQQIQKYEKGLNRVGASNLHRLAEVLGVDVSFFFHGLKGTDASLPDRASAESPTDMLGNNSLQSREILKLASYYAQIPDADIRRSILGLVKELSAGADKLR